MFQRLAAGGGEHLVDDGDLGVKVDQRLEPGPCVRLTPLLLGCLGQGGLLADVLWFSQQPLLNNQDECPT